MSSTLTQDISGGQPPRSPATAPLVAVSATADSQSGSPHRVRLNSTYITALASAGLIPLIVPPLASEAAAFDILQRVDGLLLTGGEDVEPSIYGQPRSSGCGPSNAARDATEIALVRAARTMRKPLLAICRGPQLLNVALGGTLIQDIPTELTGALRHEAREDRTARVHEVDVVPDSRIAESIGATSIKVNSLHHQSVKDVAPGMHVTARAPDGVIEGIEADAADWWAVGVQWHPEEMNDSPEPWDRGIFRAFAKQLAGE